MDYKENKLYYFIQRIGASPSQKFNKNFWRRAIQGIKDYFQRTQSSMASLRSKAGAVKKLLNRRVQWKIVDKDSQTGTPSIVCLPVHVLKIFLTVDVIWIVNLLWFFYNFTGYLDRICY